MALKKETDCRKLANTCQFEVDDILVRSRKSIQGLSQPLQMRRSRGAHHLQSRGIEILNYLDLR